MKQLSAKKLVILAIPMMLILAALLYAFYEDVRLTYRQSFEQASEHLEKRQMISSMFSVARKRSLLIFSMYHETDPFVLEEMYQEFIELASPFISARERLLAMNLSEKELQVLNSLGPEINSNAQLQREVARLLIEGVRDEQASQKVYQALSSQNRILNQINSVVKHYENKSVANLVDLQTEKEAVDRKFATLTALLLIAGMLFVGLLIYLVAAREKRHLQLQLEEKQKTAEKLTYQASHDSLTGLINRFSLEDRMKQAIHFARRSNAQMAVMMIDMDRFKHINDSLGHQAGDELLKQVASRLRMAVLRETDIVARLGGDEFVVVLTGIERDASVIAGLVARTLVHLLGQPYLINASDVHSSPSIGVSIYPLDGNLTDELIKNADAAMYHVKEKGRNNFHFFTEEMNQQIKERLVLEHEIRIALSEKQFELFYQPQFDESGTRICAAEALIRWNHPEHGYISPDRFIPVAEDSGLIYDIGRWVCDEACRQQVKWSRQGIIDIPVAINLSAHGLRSADLVHEIKMVLDKYGVKRDRLGIEITETAAMDDPENAAQQLQGLSKLGVNIAIDDFGTGYSSLSYLKRLPIDTLKLDRSFVKAIESDQHDAAISSATISVAHNLELRVVAEGVETAGQFAFLSERTCDVYQGYHFCKPLPVHEFEAFIANRNKKSA